MQPMRFILQAVDPEYGHPSFETMFVVEHPEELRTLIGIDPETDPDFERFYWLEPHEVSAVIRHFGLGFEPDGRQTALIKGSDQPEPPYLVHTNYELVLMIEGRKHFARMHGDFYPPSRFDGEERFDRYVALGLLHKEEELDEFPKPTLLKDGRIVDVLAEGARSGAFPPGS